MPKFLGEKEGFFFKSYSRNRPLLARISLLISTSRESDSDHAHIKIFIVF